MKTLFLFICLFSFRALAQELLCDLPLEKLRPTQGSVGLEEVMEKKLKLEEKWRAGKLPKEMRDEAAPAVLGPDQKWHILDGHHFMRSVVESDIPQSEKKVCVKPLRDGSNLEWSEFYRLARLEGWPWAFNELDEPILPENIPALISELPDNVYRSLAAKVRKAGGFNKSSVFYAEFQWAKFLRGQGIAPTDVKGGVAAAKSPAASALPGYIAPEQSLSN